MGVITIAASFAMISGRKILISGLTLCVIILKKGIAFT